MIARDDCSIDELIRKMKKPEIGAIEAFFRRGKRRRWDKRGRSGSI